MAIGPDNWGDGVEQSGIHRDPVGVPLAGMGRGRGLVGLDGLDLGDAGT